MLDSSSSRCNSAVGSKVKKAVESEQRVTFLPMSLPGRVALETEREV